MEQKTNDDDAMDGEIELRAPNGVPETVNGDVVNGHAGKSGATEGSTKGVSSETRESESSRSSDVEPDTDLRKRHSVLEILQAGISRGGENTEEKWKPFKDIRCVTSHIYPNMAHQFGFGCVLLIFKQHLNHDASLCHALILNFNERIFA